MNDKIYLPEWANQNGWQYYFNNHDIIVYTNQNCYQNYNTTYCDCYRIQTDNHYLHSDSYSCSYNNKYNYTNIHNIITIINISSKSISINRIIIIIRT